jgi:hypothetical protein
LKNVLTDKKTNLYLELAWKEGKLDKSIMMFEPDGRNLLNY